MRDDGWIKVARTKTGFVLTEGEIDGDGDYRETRTHLDNVEEVVGAVRFALQRGMTVYPSLPTLCMIEGCENIGFARHPTKVWNVGEPEPLLCETHAVTFTIEEIAELGRDHA